jgi:hypothetical protein
VGEPGVRPVVLIVDQDLGFVCWLGELLAQAGCRAVPALNSRDAVRLVADLNLPIDVAIVDPGLGGVGEAIKTLRGQYPSLRTIAIGTPGQDAAGAIDAKDSLARPRDSARISRQECLKNVRTVLRRPGQQPELVVCGGQGKRGWQSGLVLVPAPCSSSE